MAAAVFLCFSTAAAAPGLGAEDAAEARARRPAEAPELVAEPLHGVAPVDDDGGRGLRGGQGAVDAGAEGAAGLLLRGRVCCGGKMERERERGERDEEVEATKRSRSVDDDRTKEKKKLFNFESPNSPAYSAAGSPSSLTTTTLMPESRSASEMAWAVAVFPEAGPPETSTSAAMGNGL